MRVNPLVPPPWPVYLADPIARDHPLNRDRVGWWLALSGIEGGRQFFDLAGLRPGLITGMDAASGWRSSARDGGASALLFDGTNDYVDVDPFPATVSGYTVHVWFRRNGNGHLVEHNTGSNNGWRLWCAPNLYFTYGAIADYPTSLATTAGIWQLAVVTVQGSAAVVYLGSGGVVTAAPLTVAAAPAGTPTRLGFGGPLNGNYYSGYLDDIGVINRVWTADDVAAYYEVSRRGHPGLLNRVRPSGATVLFGGAAVAPAVAYSAALLMTT